MKTAIITIAVIALIGVGYLLALQFQPTPNNSALIAQHNAERQEYKSNALGMVNEIIRLGIILDSLKDIEPEIERQIVYLQADIDSAIAIDSSNAVQEYRKGLLKLSIQPESTFTLTFREIGYGGLLFAELYGMRLKVGNLHEILSEQDGLIGKQEKLLEVKDNIAVLDSLTIYGLEQTIEIVKPKWYQSPIAIVIWALVAFGLGLAVAL